MKVVAVVLIVAFSSLGSGQAIAGPVPSKTSVDQSIASRDADLQSVRNVIASEEVASALQAQGFTTEEVNSRLAALSDQDLRSLTQNLEQIQAAGLTRQEWAWIAIGALAVLVLVLVLD
ncbi:MAG TPA: PA2779 family protein [Thermoanaerobaculia bacterium]|nr:PA2779 family protein [Thermoanaerobaculia bacterium]